MHCQVGLLIVLSCRICCIVRKDMVYCQVGFVVFVRKNLLYCQVELIVLSGDIVYSVGVYVWEFKKNVFLMLQFYQGSSQTWPTICDSQLPRAV